MNQPSTTRRALLAFFASALAGCGGGVGSGGTGIGTGGSEAPPGWGFVQGLVTGLDPLVVAGVQVDLDPGDVYDEDGNALPLSQLRVGMVVSAVASSPITGNVLSKPGLVVHFDLVGPVTGTFSDRGGQLSVLGVPLLAGGQTMADEFDGGLAGIPLGAVVGVSTMFDPVGGQYVVTRVTPLASPKCYALRGVASEIDANSRRLNVGKLVFDYSGLASEPQIIEGELVRVTMSATPNDDGSWPVLSLGSGATPAPTNYKGSLNGVVGPVLSPTLFSVAGIPVDAGGPNVFVGQLDLELLVAPGMHVTVQGSMQGNRLVATQVMLTALPDSFHDDVLYQVAGAIVGAVDTTAQTFALDAPLQVLYDKASFAGGTAADLAAGRRVVVIGYPGDNGTLLAARSVTFLP